MAFMKKTGIKSLPALARPTLAADGARIPDQMLV
jgi:hypothetical protein